MNRNGGIEKNFSAIILAAGKSERLGFPKLSLRYKENHIFIEHIANEYIKFGCKEIVLVVNKNGSNYLIKNKIKFSDEVKIVINEHPEWHRFYSLKIGVKTILEIHPVFIHNVDNPFVNHEVLNELMNNTKKADYISPEFVGKGGHPILLTDKIIQDLKTIKEDQIHLKEFLNKYPKIKVSVDDDKILVNINTLEEYGKYFDY